MTPNQATNLIFKYFLVSRDRYNSHDAILRLIMTKHYEDLFRNFEGTFQYIQKETHATSEDFYGEVIVAFQKSFRQTDVLGSASDDMIVWHTLSGAETFHKVCRRVFRHVWAGQSYEDCVEDYFQFGREPDIDTLIDRPKPETPVIAYAQLFETGRVELSWAIPKKQLTSNADQKLIDMDGMDRVQYMLNVASKIREERIERLKKYDSEKQT